MELRTSGYWALGLFGFLLDGSGSSGFRLRLQSKDLRLWLYRVSGASLLVFCFSVEFLSRVRARIPSLSYMDA